MIMVWCRNCCSSVVFLVSRVLGGRLWVCVNVCRCLVLVWLGDWLMCLSRWVVSGLIVVKCIWLFVLC